MGSTLVTGVGSGMLEARRTKGDCIKGLLAILGARQGFEDLERRCVRRIDRRGAIAMFEENYIAFSIAVRTAGGTRGCLRLCIRLALPSTASF